MNKREPLWISEAGYRATLLEKRRLIMEGVGFRTDTFASIDNLAEDDQAQVYHDEFVSFRLNSLDHAQLKQIEEALSRLDSGDYGRCLCCDGAIPQKRLRALPWAQYCLRCQDSFGTALAPEI